MHNRPSLYERKILLGVTGSISAYKSCDLVRLLRKEGAQVQVVLTADAARFVAPLTLATLSGREVYTDLFPAANESGDWTRHVSLGLWADALLIAPATAQTIARMAHGFADSLLAATVLSASCPVLVCPAMDRDMYQNAAIQANLTTLKAHGHQVMPADHGELASGLIGQGRLPAAEAITDRLKSLLGVGPGPLSGKTALVTAGPTREPLDPVRVLTNPSTGTMGYALAAALAKRGATVSLVSGPTALDPPAGVQTTRVGTAAEMRDAVLARRSADIIFMAAAVSDYAPAHVSKQKRKKGKAPVSLALHPTPDILLELAKVRSPSQIVVGFAMETDRGEQQARKKLSNKQLDWIVLNNLSDPGAGFGVHTNRVTVFSADGACRELPLMDKRAVAESLLDIILVQGK